MDLDVIITSLMVGILFLIGIICFLIFWYSLSLQKSSSNTKNNYSSTTYPNNLKDELNFQKKDDDGPIKNL